MDAELSEPVSDNGAAAASPAPLERLVRAQVFARDPEEITPVELDFVIAELTKINVRNRKARKDDEAVAAMTVKVKKTNVAAKKKKTAGALPADILEAKL
jgi:hypothetical protein